MFSPMDPEEEITIAFDFSNMTKTISSPEIEVTVYSGEDPEPNGIKDGTPQIYENNKVLQRIKETVDGVNYQFKCKVVAANGDVLIHTEILPVRTFPYIG